MVFALRASSGINSARFRNIPVLVVLAPRVADFSLVGKNLNNDYNGCGIIRTFQASLDSWF